MNEAAHDIVVRLQVVGSTKEEIIMTMFEAIGIIESYVSVQNIIKETDAEMVRLQENLFHKADDFKHLKELTKKAETVILEKVYNLGVTKNEKQMINFVKDYVKSDFNLWMFDPEEDFEINDQPLND